MIEATPAAPSGTAHRRRDLDRLRALACLTTLVYHAIQIFDLNNYYHIKSHTPSAAIDVAARLLHAVRMPLFFLLAGMAAVLALGKLDDRRFMAGRLRRLLPPFIVGVLLLTPWIKYFEVLDGRSITWSGITLLTGDPPALAVTLRRYFTQFRWFTWSHMWFPIYLLAISALLLGVLRRIRTVSTPLASPVLLALWPLAALAAVEVGLRPFFPWHIPNLFWDWASVAAYVICFVWGAWAAHRPELEAALRRMLPLTAMVALAGLWLYVVRPDGWPLVGIGRALWLWAVLATVIGAGAWIGSGRIPGERYLAEAALPIYVLHHVPLVAIGYVVKDQPWPISQRYGLIVAGALAVTLAVYHLLVRPFDPVRLAFGMSRRR